MKTVTVKFHHRLYGENEYRYSSARGGRPSPNDKEYDYLYDGAKKVEEGSIAVVHTPTSGFTCVTVVRVVAGKSEKATKHIADVVDVSGYEKALHNERRRQEINAELRAMAAKVEEAMKFRWLADANPNAAELLEELDAINGVVLHKPNPSRGIEEERTVPRYGQAGPVDEVDPRDDVVEDIRLRD